MTLVMAWTGWVLMCLILAGCHIKVVSRAVSYADEKRWGWFTYFIALTLWGTFLWIKAFEIAEQIR